MKILIKLSIVAILLTMVNESFAQKFGIKAGLNLSNMVIKENDNTYSDDYKMNPGFHIGPTVELPINEVMSFESGLLFSTKGFKVNVTETFGNVTYENKANINLLYLDVPLTAKAAFDVGSLKIYGTFGPYIGIGLSGKAKTEFTEGGETEAETEDINFGSDDEDDLKRLDYGLTVGAGMEFSSIQIGLTYGLGLANITTYTENGNKINNRILGISVGYKFGGE